MAQSKSRMMGIDDFLGSVSRGGGIAMSNMFEVQLPPVANVNGMQKGMSILCSKVDLPMRQVTTIESRSGVDVEKVAYGYAVADVAMSFYLLNDYSAKQYFEAWQNLALNQKTLEIGYDNEYKKPVIIRQLRKGTGFAIARKKLYDAGKIPSSIRGRLPRLGPLDFAQGEFDLNLISSNDVVYECKLINAFPTSVAAIPFSAAGGGLLEVNVQLSYKNWESEFVSNPASQLADALIGGLISKL
jgi:hypothetical protein